MTETKKPNNISAAYACAANEVINSLCSTQLTELVAGAATPPPPSAGLSPAPQVFLQKS